MIRQSLKQIKYFITAWILCFHTAGIAQNLIPDSAFGAVTLNSLCEPPYLAISYADYWYGVENATVDLFMGNCKHELIGTGPNLWPFWAYPNTSNSFMGLWGRYRMDLLRSSEVFGTPFLETLNEGQFYHFSIDIRYRGLWHEDDDFTPINCNTTTPRSLEVFINEGTITGTEVELGDVIEVDANNILTLTTAATVDTIATLNWSTLTACFEATGGETDIAVGLSMGIFEAPYPCDSNHFERDHFGLYYFNMDNLKVIPFPPPTTDTVLLCTERGTVNLDITSYFDPATLDFVSFEWRDGYEGTVRDFTQPGYYYFDAYVECGVIPFEIFIEEKRCEAIVFVPNAFTPNFDGDNDELFPFFGHDFPITNFQFRVFDRWGNLFYRSTINDGFTGWDGRVNGVAADIGIYVWSLEFDLITPEGVKPYQVSGDVLLVR